MQRQSSTRIYEYFFGANHAPELPIELTLMIFAKFRVREIPVLALVNFAWNSLVNENVLWQERFLDRYPDQYNAVLSKNLVNWREELQHAEANQTPLQKLDRFIEKKMESATNSDRELLAANALRAVILGHIGSEALVDYYYFYLNGKLKVLYKEIEQKNLIPVAMDETEEDYGYGRASYN